MIEYVLIGILILFVFAILFSFVGKKLGLFSDELLKKYMPSIIKRWIAYFVSGFIWFLGKIHFPGIETAVTFGFDNKVGIVLRAAYWKCRVKELGRDVIIDVGAKAVGWKGISIGDNTWIDRNVILETGTIDKQTHMVFVKRISPLIKEGELKIGKYVHISKNVVIQAHGGVFIGDFSGLAAGAKIYSLSLHYKNMAKDDGKIYSFSPLVSPNQQSLIQGSVILEENNGVGLNSAILPGVTIGKNSWVGLCSYVVADIPPNSIATGCPAKVVKTLSTAST